MSLAGEGAIAIWQDAPAAVRADYYEWHNREHMGERVGIPGFRRGSRWAALAGSPEFFNLYETDTPFVHTGADYLHRLNNPTPTTRRVAPHMTGNIRSLCRVACSLGAGQGGLAVTLRYDVAEGRDEEQRRLLVRGLLPELVERPGVCAAHLLLGDRAASSIQTEEKKGRPAPARTPGWIVVVEGAADRDMLESACAELLGDAALAAAGALAPVERGTYRLQYVRTKP